MSHESLLSAFSVSSAFFLEDCFRFGFSFAAFDFSEGMTSEIPETRRAAFGIAMPFLTRKCSPQLLQNDEITRDGSN
jgi:hypothetical protein